MAGTMPDKPLFMNKGDVQFQERSKFWPGIARAMAQQWGRVSMNASEKRRAKSMALSRKHGVELGRLFVETGDLDDDILFIIGWLGDWCDPPDQHTPLLRIV